MSNDSPAKLKDSQKESQDLPEDPSFDAAHEQTSFVSRQILKVKDDKKGEIGGEMKRKERRVKQIISAKAKNNNVMEKKALLKLLSVDNQVVEKASLKDDISKSMRVNKPSCLIIRRSSGFYQAWHLVIASFNFFGFFFYLGSVTYDKEKHEDTFIIWDTVFTTMFVTEMVLKFFTEQ